ncbi:MAG: response regulator [Spartobacteria bacterium]|nr:response regulator [Spartobacteria bacterium]
MRTILSIDDDEAILRCFQRALSLKGYNILTTSDPEEAYKVIQETRLDLVMLDVKMPHISGFQIFEELKKYSTDLPVLFVTAYPGSFSLESQDTVEMWEHCFTDGYTDILYKPFDLETLYEKIEGLIGPSDAEDA